MGRAPPREGWTISPDALTFLLTSLVVIATVHSVYIFAFREFDGELGPSGQFIIAGLGNLIISALSTLQYMIVVWFMRHRMAPFSIARRALTAIAVATITAVTGPEADVVPWPLVLVMPGAFVYTALTSLGCLLLATQRSDDDIVDKNYIR